MSRPLELYFIVMENIEELSNENNTQHLCVVDFMLSDSRDDARIQLENNIRNKYNKLDRHLKLDTVMFHAVPRNLIHTLKEEKGLPMSVSQFTEDQRQLIAENLNLYRPGENKNTISSLEVLLRGVREKEFVINLEINKETGSAEAVLFSPNNNTIEDTDNNKSPVA